MSRLEVVDDRFERLARELREARPLPTDALRRRVALLAHAEPERERRETPRARLLWGRSAKRVALAVAVLAIAVPLVAAGVQGLHDSVSSNRAPGVAGRNPSPEAASSTGEANRAVENAPVEALRGSGIAPASGRLQQYDATLRLRVRNVEALSSATKRAMSLTRALGGYVGAVDYSTRGGKRGGATLVLRVPVAKVETALTELASFGTILQQRASILDVTRRAERESKQIARLQRELETADPARAAEIRARLKTLRAKHARLVRSAHFARISLTLNTAPRAAAAPGRLDRTLDDAGAVLVRELEILLYALVVAGPLLLLGAAGVATARTARRRADRRLLERA